MDHSMKAGQHRVALLLHIEFVVRVFLFRPDGGCAIASANTLETQRGASE